MKGLAAIRLDAQWGTVAAGDRLPDVVCFNHKSQLVVMWDCTGMGWNVGPRLRELSPCRQKEPRRPDSRNLSAFHPIPVCFLKSIFC